MSERLKPCPFCGVVPNIQPWHGGSRTKKMISCDNTDCDVAPQVTGETASEAMESWNHRDPAQRPLGSMNNVQGGR